jgi:hypothetical protein
MFAAERASLSSASQRYPVPTPELSTPPDHGPYRHVARMIFGEFIAIDTMRPREKRCVQGSTGV